MLIDCFTLNNEIDILEGRLEYLYDIVDMFIIVEANITHNGTPKILNYLDNIQRLKKFSDKILYCPIYVNPKNYDFVTVFDDEYKSGLWKVENEQRNHIMQGLQFFEDDAFVMISDLDEIPKKTSIINAMNAISEENLMIGFKQDLYFYNLNQKQIYECYGTVLCKNKTVKDNSPQFVRSKRWRHYIPYIDNAGWHLSYWGSPEEIRNKIITAPHQIYNKPKFRNVNNIIEKIITSQDLFERDNPLAIVDRSTHDQEFYNIFSKYEYKIEDNFDKLTHYYENVDGWFYRNDTLFYKQIIDHFESGHFVEIGSYKGRSSSFMGVEIALSGKDIKFDCIDTWLGSEEHQIDGSHPDLDVINGSLYDKFLQNIEPVKDYINPIRTDSLSACKLYDDNSLDFVFIDAAHDYESVKADVISWLPKIKLGGILSGHDYQIEDVSRAVNEILYHQGVNVLNGSCWWIYKK